MTFFALEAGDAKRLEQAARFAHVAEDGARGLCGAFEWLPPSMTAPVVKAWISASDQIKVAGAQAAISAHSPRVC